MLTFTMNVVQFQACTGLDMAQVETLKKCFDSMDKEQNGSISAAAIQMIFKMLGVTVQKAGLGMISLSQCTFSMNSTIQFISLYLSADDMFW